MRNLACVLWMLFFPFLSQLGIYFESLAKGKPIEKDWRDGIVAIVMLIVWVAGIILLYEH
jgi:hypothetical protein